jgi:hypothetical protein
MGCDIVPPDGQERAGTDMQCHGGPGDTPALKRVQQFRGEVQARGGGRDRAFLPGEDGLVVGVVRWQRPGGTIDIRRQRERPCAVQRVPESLAGQVEGHRHPAIGIAGLDGSGQVIGPIEMQQVPGAEAAGVAGERMPGPVWPRLVERDADPCVAPPCR